MSFQDNGGFKMLKEAFNEFATKQAPLMGKGNQIGEAVMVEIQTMISRGKMPSQNDMNDVVKKAVAKVITRQDIENLTADVRDLLTGTKTSTGIAMVLGSLDVSQVDKMVTDFVDSMKDPQQGLQIAKAIKDMANQPGIDDLGPQLSALIDGAPLPAAIKPLVEMQADRFARFVENAKFMSEQDIADAVARFADEIPTKMVSDMLYGVASSMSAETVSELLASAAASLPTPEKAGDLYDAAMGNTGNKPADKPANNDNAPKKDNKGGNPFKFGNKGPK